MAAAKDNGTTVSRSDLVAKVAEQVGLGSGQITEIVRAYETAMKEALAGGNSVRLSDLGKFSVSHRAERQGRNPQTGDAMTVAARSAPKFTPSKSFKDLVDQANQKKGKSAAKGAAKSSAASAKSNSAKSSTAAGGTAKGAAGSSAKGAAKGGAKSSGGRGKKKEG